MCSVYKYCADEGLEANCCPDEVGKFLACCAGIPNDNAASDDEDDAATSKIKKISRAQVRNCITYNWALRNGVYPQ